MFIYITVDVEATTSVSKVLAVILVVPVSTLIVHTS